LSTPLPRPAPGVPTTRHGLFEYALPGGFTGVGHGGSTLSFRSNLVLVPALNLGVFVSTNSDRGTALTEALPNRIVQRFYASETAPAAGSHALIEDRGAFEGVYLTNRRAYHGLEQMIDRLIGAATVSVTGDGKLTVGGDPEQKLYVPLGPPALGRFVSEDGARTLVFRMRGGRAIGFFSPTGENTFDRIDPWRQNLTLVMATLLTMATALMTVADVFSRRRRDFRESSSQRRAGTILTTQATLWLLAAGLFAFWALGAEDVADVMYNWPGVVLIGASACALVTSLMSVPTILMTPLIWRGGRRLDSWTGGRKARFTLTAVVFAAFAMLLATWGALEPWSR
jgi:hypothetical protein